MRNLVEIFSPNAVQIGLRLLSSVSFLLAAQTGLAVDRALPESYFSYQEVYQFQESVGSCEMYKDCREVLSEYARLNSHILSYDDARFSMFHDLDVIESEYGERVYRTIYELKTFKVPDQGLPNHSIVNTEHTFPRSLLKHGRDYSKSKSDLMHLFPAVSTVNSKRGSKPFGDCNGNGREWRVCSNGFEPPHVHKGTIARAMFYVAIAYDLDIDPKQEATLRAWAKAFPVTNSERVRAHRVYLVQGNRNPFIDHPEWIDLILDF